MKQNRIRPLHFRWVVLLILVLTVSTVSAQIEVPVSDEIWEPALSDVPPTMAYQPPADASEMADFAPADVEVKPISAETDAKANAAFDETKNNLLTFGDKQIGVFVEEKTFSEDVMLEFTKLETPQLAIFPVNEESKIPLPPITATNTISNPVVSRDLVRFQLEIVSSAKADTVTSFEKPVRIVLDLRALTQELNPVYTDFYLAYQDEKDPTIWHDVPITVYQEDGLFSADVLHFSNWAAGVRPQRWNPSWSPPDVSAFSGAVTYSYPIEVPPGRNGLQPNVSLSYSSRVLDGHIHDPEEGAIGTGWSLAEIKIVRVGVKLRFDAGNLPETYHPDKFRLVFNGSGYELYPDGSTSGNDVRYYVKDAPGMFVERHYDAANTATDGLYWVVITPDGTRYRLGRTDDSEEYQTAPYHYYITVDGHGGHSGYTSAIAWNVDTVTDPFGNQMTYHYYTRTTNESIGYWDGTYWQNKVITTRSSRIATIKYNFPDRVTSLPPSNTVAQLTSTPGTRIEFRASSGDTGGAFTNPITSIYIYHGGSASPTTEYRISSGNVAVAAANPYCQNYNVVPSQPLNSNTWTVNSIQQWVNTNSNPVDADAGYALPATTFTYSPLTHYTTGSGNCFSFMYLTGYQNGYGGSVTFSYSSDNRKVGIYQRHEETYYYWIEWPTIGYNYRVSTVLANDGRNPSVKTTYTYTQPCYGQWGTPPAGAVNCSVADSPEYGNIVGHATTTQTNYDYDGTTILNKQTTTFSQAANTSIGRPTQIDVYVGSTTLMSRTNNYYATESINGLANMFTYTSQTTTKNYSNGLNTPDISSKVTYQYIPANQGGVQYGNLTHIKEYDDINAATYYRETRRTYYPNTTIVGGTQNWLVGLVGVEGIYDSAGALQSGTWYHYDGSNGNANTPPTKGALTRLSKIVPTSCGSFVGCAYARQTIDTYSTYNGYGNLTTTTTYAEYGTRYFDSSWAILQDSPPTTTARTTSIAYETGYNLYPVQVSNPLTHPTTFEVYGFKDINGTVIAVDGFQKQPGLLKAVIDPNGVTTTYEYDPFGRLYQIYGQGDSRGDVNDPFDGDPMTRYRYWDNSWNNSGQIWVNPLGNQPFGISVHTRPSVYSASAPYVMKHLTYFDGFGRTIQEQEFSVEVSGASGRRTVVTTTAYHAQGQASCVSIPYDVADAEATWPNNSFVNTACSSLARTTTTYDGLGRPTTITAPDNSVTTYAYAVTDNTTVNGVSRLNRTLVYDALNRLTNYFYDNRGQLVKIRENTGVNPYTAYAETEYTYDLMGNLIAVHTKEPTQNGAGTILRTVSMSYDNFGRKIGMVDPDMGTWSYSYNAAGSLIRQKDARGNQLCFSYDELDRLETRTLDSTPADACPATPPTSGSYHLATYTYDTATNNGGGIVTGVGLPATISWGPTPGQNKDTFFYDTLGRLTKHHRRIDNRVYSMVTTSFDPLHRPLTIQYPDGEVVTLTYDHEGEQTLQAGADMLVDNVTYNGRGQLVKLERPNGLDTTLSYFGQNDATGGGPGDSNFRLKTLQHGNYNSGDKPDFDYTYDLVGNILSVNTLSSVGTDTQTYTYDDLNRLLTAGATGGVANYSQTYAYDKLGNMTSGPNGTYNYTTWHANCTSPPSQPLPHAVHKIGSYYFCYDNNGNMTTRSDSTGTYTQVFDVENRLTSVTPSGGSATTFAYDANGIRTKTVQPGGITTYFPFPGYEETVNGANTIKRSSYSFAGQTVAMRVSGDPVSGNNGLFYVLSDHLGSTSMLVNSSGGAVAGSTTRNLPYGGYRPGSAPTQTITDRDFTGQKENMELGLLYYQARYYVPGIGRFASADTIVPNPASPQSYNRYSYVLNSPINYFDPDGHNPVWCNDPYDSGGGSDCNPLVDFTVQDNASVDWDFSEKATIINGAGIVDFALLRHGSSFQNVYGGTVTFTKTGASASNLGEATRDQATRAHVILVNEQEDGGTVNSEGTMWVAHELGHSFNNALSPNQTEPNYSHGQGVVDLAQEGVWANGDLISGAVLADSWLGPYKRDFSGYTSNRAPYIQNDLHTVSEDYADMFSNYVHNSFATNVFGQERYNFMDSHMSGWIALAVSNNE